MTDFRWLSKVIVSFLKANLRLDDPLSKAAYNYYSQVLPRPIGRPWLDMVLHLGVIRVQLAIVQK